MYHLFAISITALKKLQADKNKFIQSTIIDDEENIPQTNYLRYFSCLWQNSKSNIFVMCGLLSILFNLFIFLVLVCVISLLPFLLTLTASWARHLANQCVWNHLTLYVQYFQ